MIRKIKFSNFYSFKDEQILDFTAQKKKNYSYFNSKADDQISKIVGFAGPNASGKTNSMRILSFLGHFICVSRKDDLNSNFNIAFKTFFEKQKTSRFYIEFELQDKLFFYQFSIKKDQIIKEDLTFRLIKKYSRELVLFSRDKNGVKSVDKDYISGLSLKLLSKLRPDISLIAFLNSVYEFEIISQIYNYFSRFKTNINEKGEINNLKYQINSLNLYLADNEIRKKANQLIKNFDVGLDGFEIKKNKESDKIVISAYGKHNVDGAIIPLGLRYESRGTQLLLFTLVRILYALKHQTYVVIDELEYGLHPDAVNKLLSYFIDEAADKAVQLFFSSHSLGFFNILDQHQIYLVEKNKNCESQMYRLNQVEGIRSDDNFLAKYLSGAYGAFPQIRI